MKRYKSYIQRKFCFVTLILSTLLLTITPVTASAHHHCGHRCQVARAEQCAKEVAAGNSC